MNHEQLEGLASTSTDQLKEKLGEKAVVVVMVAQYNGQGKFIYAVHSRGDGLAALGLLRLGGKIVDKQIWEKGKP